MNGFMNHNRDINGVLGAGAYPTMITAHAGAENTPPNTAESLRILLALGADAVEVDVRRVNGLLILSHDEPILNKSVFTLAEALGQLRDAPGAMMNVDVKHEGMIVEVQQLAREYGVTDRLLFTGDIGGDDERDIKNGGIPLWINQGLLPRRDWDDPLPEAERRGFHIVNIDKRKVTEQMLSRADRFSVWTVNDEKTLRALLTAGVKNITTRQPVLALRLRGEIQKPGAGSHD